MRFAAFKGDAGLSLKLILLLSLKLYLFRKLLPFHCVAPGRPRNGRTHGTAPPPIQPTAQ